MKVPAVYVCICTSLQANQLLGSKMEYIKNKNLDTENYGAVLIRSFGSFAEYTCFWKNFHFNQIAEALTCVSITVVYCSLIAGPF